jgi:ADP-ribose pyrophosphatase
MNRGRNNGSWKCLSRKEVYDGLPWLRVFVDTVRLPSGRVVEDFHQIEAPDFAMVCARRADGKILLERQYKYAAGKVTYCLPGGCVAPRETPLKTAKREFLEETGYRASKWIRVGTFPVDSTRGCGRGHFYIADALEKVAEPVDDDMEDVEVIFLSPSAVMKAILKSGISSISSIALILLATNQATTARLRRRPDSKL